MEKQNPQDSPLMSCYKFYEEIQNQENQKPQGERAFVAKKNLWEKKLLTDNTIYFHILQKNPAKDAEVRRAFQAWKSIKIWLNFKETQDLKKAQIKIKYGSGNQADYSYVGVDNMTLSQRTDHTMSLSFNNQNKQKYFGTILHEIGHAIGLQHEHQNPFGDIKWNQPVVRQYYGGYPEQTLQHNIFRPAASKSQSWGTSVDRESIMIYDFPNDCFLSPADLKQKGAASKGVLTDKDISFVKTLYPDPTEVFTPIKNNNTLQSKVAGAQTSLVIYFENPTTDFFTLQDFKNSQGKVEDEPEKVTKWNSTSTWAFSGKEQTSGSLTLKSGLTDNKITVSWNVSSQSDGGIIEDVSQTIKVLSGKGHKVRVSYANKSTGIHTIARLTVEATNQLNQAYYNFPYKQ